ncbi:MAG: helix-turn-helix domain-containing protein [Alphaproteobacteria bacterium]|nr:helix-turn-helix domain-containing protein [Alphaproteobacteria bacterium]
MGNQAKISYSELDPQKEKGRVKEIDGKIGERLKEIRKRKRLNQSEIADILDISFQQFQKYENGKNRISFASILELSDKLNMPLDYFTVGLEEQAAQGLSDNQQEGLAEYPNKLDIPAKETDELLDLYYSLEDPKLRKNLLKFVKSMVENLKGNPS